MKHKKLKFVIIFQIIILLSTHNVAAYENKKEKIHKFIMHYADKGFLNGAVLVAENGVVIYKNAYGIANRDWNIPHRIDGIFQIYSMSKQFTSLIMLQLAEEGKVNLDDPITKYLDYYRKDTGDRITIHHILSHTHGITMPDWNAIPASLNVPLNSFVEVYLSGDLMFEPGSESHYGSVGRGHVVAAAVIEKVTGQPFETVLADRILYPLGMKETGIFWHNVILPRYVGSYFKSGGVITKRIDRNSSQKMGASSMYSTIDDLFLWDRALYTDKLLSKPFIERMCATHIPMSGMHYGYGVRISSIEVEGKEKKLIWHTGGGVNLICRSIEDGHTVIFLNNISTNLLLYDTAVEIFKILYGLPYEFVKMHVSHPMVEMILQNHGVDQAISHYHDIKSNSSQYYIFHEDELNILGNYLMENNNISDVIKIFNLNVSEYSNSSNVYVNLGETYMKNGQKNLAIQNFKKSLELNPENTHTIEMLKKLEHY